MAVRQACTQVTGSPSNLGKGGCSLENPFKPFKTLILTDESFSIDTLPNVATLATWEAGIKDGLVYPILGMFDYEMPNVEAEYYESPLKKRTLTRMGERRMKFHLNLPLDVHQKLQTYSGRSVRVVLADEANNLFMTYSGGVYKGFSVDMITAEKQEWVDSGASKPATSMLSIDFKSYMDWDVNGVTLAPSEFQFTDLVPLTDVNIEVVGTPTATSIVTRVYSNGIPTGTGAENKVAILGLVKADFILLKADGTTQTSAISTTVDNEDGTYTHTCVGAVAGTVKLVAPDVLSDGFLQCGTPATVTIA
jgi:hypothetical protein